MVNEPERTFADIAFVCVKTASRLITIMFSQNAFVSDCDKSVLKKLFLWEAHGICLLLGDVSRFSHIGM